MEMVHTIQTRITKCLGIRYPFFQGAMAWITGWEIAAAVSNAGGLGTIASAILKPDEIVDEIRQIKQATTNPFAVNIPIRLTGSKEAVEVAIAEKVPVVVTSTGDPAIYTEKLHNAGIMVFHVAFSLEMVSRCNDAKVDAVIIMGSEAGGNLGPEELTTMVLVPQAVQKTRLPVVAAGGIGDGKGFLAALALGAEGIQMGTRILATRECTVHARYKEAVLRARDTDTTVTGRSTGLEFRVLKNSLSQKVLEMERAGKDREEIDSVSIGGLRRAAEEGDVENGSVMMGQISGMISDILTVKELFEKIMINASQRVSEISRFF
ncbi:MAG: nitronate monooxygenase [Deltaproteobacteria bacterium]|nr:nitronate monooxygenase [Deltaproteobacteria bacterium]